MEPSSTVSPDTIIATVVDELARDFFSLTDALTTESRFSTQVPSTTVADEFSRFKLWAGNIAAHRKGRRSLEYRLRDAAHLKSETHRLLGALSDVLRNALSIANGEKIPWDELSDTDSESEDSDGDSVDSDMQGNTELNQLVTSIRTIITSLFRLSMAIRNPAPNSQSTRSITADKSFYEQHDIQHVKEKFPKSPYYLTERLGRALSARRQYLSYREEHHQKLTKNIEKLGFEKPTTEFTTNSTEATPIPGIKRTMSLNVLDEEDDIASQTSYATSVNAAIKIPPLPRDARDKDFFECPLCFLLVSIHSAAAWKQHVYRDLHPYCCTHEQCTIADRLYDSRKSWFAHELEAHWTAWQCVEECEKVFKIESDFEQHVQKSHAELASASMISALKRTATKVADLGGEASCALCGKTMTLRALQRHLGSHQQQLALFALPTNLDETEDDPDNSDEGHMSVGSYSEEELSDISETPDPEDIESNELDIAVDDPRPTSAPPPNTKPAEPQTAMGKLDAIASKFRTEFVPIAVQYMANPPEDPAKRTFEYKKLSETILIQVIFKLDGVETEGDQEARNTRNVLVKEVQGLLTKLDEVGQATGVGSNITVEKDTPEQVSGSSFDPEAEMALLSEMGVLLPAKSGTDTDLLKPPQHSGTDTDDPMHVQMQQPSQNPPPVEATDKLDAQEELGEHVFDERTPDGQPNDLDLGLSFADDAGALENFDFDSFLHTGNETDKLDVQGELGDHVLDERTSDEMNTIPHNYASQDNQALPAPPMPSAQPTYAKIHLKHLDVETLHYYDLPYEYDQDPDYIIILRELTDREADVLFEHTRLLRMKRGKNVLDDTWLSGDTQDDISATENKDKLANQADEAKEAQTRAVDDYDKQKASGERTAEEERDRIIYEYEHKKILEAEEGKEARDKPMIELNIEEDLDKQNDQKDFDDYMREERERVEEEERGKARREKHIRRENERMEQEIRKRESRMAELSERLRKRSTEVDIEPHQLNPFAAPGPSSAPAPPPVLAPKAEEPKPAPPQPAAIEKKQESPIEDNIIAATGANDLDDLFNMDDYADPEQSGFDDAFFNFD